MTIEELKEKIEKKTIGSEGLILVYKDRFLADQYAIEIAKVLGRDISYVESLESDGFFSFVDDKTISVLVCDEYSEDVPNYSIVITKKSKNPDAIQMPKIEDWCIKDYVYSVCCGVENSVLDKFSAYSKDLYRLNNELSKISIFDEKVRNTIAKEFISDDVFSGISAVDTFDFIKAVQGADISEIAKMYRDINIEPLAFVALLYRQFSNMVNVYLQQNPTSENTGLKSNQIYAIRNACKKYTRQQILDVYKFLSTIDFWLKTGYLSTDIMFDYVLFEILLILRGRSSENWNNF